MSGEGGIKKSIVVSYVSILFSILSGFLYTPWLIKELGSSDYAVYAIVISLMTYFTVDFGLGATITRFIAKYRASNEEHKIKGLLGIALKMYLVIDAVALVLLACMYLGLSGIYHGLTPAEIEKLRVVYCILGCMTVLCVPVMPLNGVFIAFGRIYNVKLLDLVNKACTIALVCTFIMLGYGLYTVVLINAIVTVAINIVKLVYIRRAEGVTVDIKYKDSAVLKQIVSFSAFVAIAMIADKFFFTIEPTLLGAFSNSTQVAIFAIATSMEGYVLTFADALNGIFLPRVTTMVVENREREEITDLLIKVGRFQLFVVAGLVLGIITQGREFITLWFGKEYELAYLSVTIVLIPCFIHLTQGIGTEMIYATNNVKYRAIAYCLGAAVNVTLTALLAPAYGSVGAAIGISAGFLVGHEVILNLVYSRVLHLNISRFFKECHLKMLLPAAICVPLGIVLSRSFTAQGRIQILLKCAAWAVIYCTVCGVFFLNKEEKKTISTFMINSAHKFRRFKSGK